MISHESRIVTLTIQREITFFFITPLTTRSHVAIVLHRLNAGEGEEGASEASEWEDREREEQLALLREEKERLGGEE